MRVFAALPLPQAATAALDAALAPVRQLHPRVRWVSAKGLHATLHFFGEVSDEQRARLQALFDGAGELQRLRIRARLGALGQFPPRGNPRVLWAGIDRGAEEMTEYWNLFESKIAPLGWSPDPRGFTPHITVARAGSIPLESGWDAGVRLPALDFFVEECVLFQSILGRAGAEYVPLARIAFGRESE